MSRYWDETRINIVKSLARDGKSATEIGAYFGRSAKVICQQCRKHDISIIHTRGMTWTKAEMAKLTEMSKAGFTRPEAAEVLNRPLKGVETKIKHMGLSFKKNRNHIRRAPIAREKPRTKRKNCLVGDHPFDARVDKNGRLLEFSCANHRAQANREDSQAMI